MRTPVIVDTPYPTVWQTAKKMGVSRKRTLELIKLAHEIVERRKQRKADELAAAQQPATTIARPRSSAGKKRLKTA